MFLSSGVVYLTPTMHYAHPTFMYIREEEEAASLVCWCVFVSRPEGGAVSHAAAARSFWLNHFTHHTQNAK